LPQILRLKYTKFDFDNDWGSAPDPAGGACSASPDPLTGFQRPTSKGREGKGRRVIGKRGKGGILLLREGRGGEGRVGKGEGKEGEGMERKREEPPGICLHPPPPDMKS